MSTVVDVKLPYVGEMPSSSKRSASSLTTPIQVFIRLVLTEPEETSSDTYATSFAAMAVSYLACESPSEIIVTVYPQVSNRVFLAVS